MWAHCASLTLSVRVQYLSYLWAFILTTVSLCYVKTEVWFVLWMQLPRRWWLDKLPDQQRKFLCSRLFAFFFPLCLLFIKGRREEAQSFSLLCPLTGFAVTGNWVYLNVLSRSPAILWRIKLFQPDGASFFFSKLKTGTVRPCFYGGISNNDLQLPPFHILPVAFWFGKHEWPQWSEQKLLHCLSLPLVHFQP